MCSRRIPSKVDCDLIHHSSCISIITIYFLSLFIEGFTLSARCGDVEHVEVVYTSPGDFGTVQGMRIDLACICSYSFSCPSYSCCSYWHMTLSYTPLGFASSSSTLWVASETFGLQEITIASGVARSVPLRDPSITALFYCESWSKLFAGSGTVLYTFSAEAQQDGSLRVVEEYHEWVTGVIDHPPLAFAFDQVCMRVFVYWYMSMRVYVYWYVHVCVYVYWYVHVCVHVHGVLLYSTYNDNLYSLLSAERLPVAGGEGRCAQAGPGGAVAAVRVPSGAASWGKYHLPLHGRRVRACWGGNVHANT
jgi:hypothetical protein